jgi:replicative superfamily II helicase
MTVLDLGQTGEPSALDTLCWDGLDLPAKWRSVIGVLAPGSRPHDIQIKALRDYRLLQSRRNLVVSGPTNSGKSLLGYLAILSGMADGRRALLIEPFRALAQEKYLDLVTLLPRLEKHLGKVPKVAITTGDYRLDGETLMASPPEDGEIVIATPERVEAILRNPDFDEWSSSSGVVCVDEAHLLADERRGPSLECVMTRFLCEKAPPRFVLLSATVGDCTAVQKWLEPCDVAFSNIRRPPLRQEIIKLDDGEEADDVLVAALERILAEPGTSAMIFVYRTADTVRLAAHISDKLKPLFGPGLAAAYHSKMAASAKADVRAAYESGKARCLVSTTALGAGVNLPATHVFVRDLTRAAIDPVPIREIVQMMGRAGRGDRPGYASVVLKPKDAWQEAELVQQIKSPNIPDLRSALLTEVTERRGQDRRSDLRPEQTARIVLGQLARRERQALTEITSFFCHSFGGQEIADRVETSVQWLKSGERILAWQEDAEVGVTALGRVVARTSLPLEVGAGFGTLIRDILSCDAEDALLSSWNPLDTLLILELLNPREKGLKRYSKDMAEQVDDWIERSPAKPALFARWIRGAAGTSRADEVLGSLGIKLEAERASADSARQYAYAAMVRAIVISQLGDGVRAEDVGRRWSISGLDGVQERWRDHLLWQLSGIAELLDVRCFYFHLKQECAADDARVAQVKQCFQTMRRGTFELLGSLRFCSPLGPFFRDLEDAKAGVGARTKEKLEALGLTTMAEIHAKSDAELISAGIRRDILKRLRAYILKRQL